jgi:GTPase involved in cell partitioning and DNA repair
MLLKGADGLVFMADTTPERLADNFDNAKLLRESLTDYAMNLADTPASIQANCIDMQTGSAVSGLLAELFPEKGSDGLIVNTATGEGVLEGLHKLIKSILARLGQSTDGVEDSVAAMNNEKLYRAPARNVDRCAAQGARYCIETAGETVCGEDGILSVPLRLVDSSGESSELLTLKISLSL